MLKMLNLALAALIIAASGLAYTEDADARARSSSSRSYSSRPSKSSFSFGSIKSSPTRVRNSGSYDFGSLKSKPSQSRPSSAFTLTKPAPVRLAKPAPAPVSLTKSAAGAAVVTGVAGAGASAWAQPTPKPYRYATPKPHKVKRHDGIEVDDIIETAAGVAIGNAISGGNRPVIINQTQPMAAVAPAAVLPAAPTPKPFDWGKLLMWTGGIGLLALGAFVWLKSRTA